MSISLFHEVNILNDCKILKWTSMIWNAAIIEQKKKI